MEVIAVLLWHVWKARNRCLFHHQEPDLVFVVEAAWATSNLGKHLQSTITRSIPPSSAPGSLWRPPDPGTLKINIDGAFRSGNISGSTAYICRDHTGSMQEGFTCAATANSSLQIEVQALNIALRHLLRIEKSDEPLIIETDCLQVVDAVHDPQKTPWESRSLLAETAALLPCFSHLLIRFTKRKTNALADWVAKAHSRGSLSFADVFPPPPALFNILLSNAVQAGCFLALLK
ncbi:uncharacterized protein LOC120296010 [Eucalyptus grandis]|uniref:uncharacterized protein LOC120296010 n=1 Tax=Eucalyptus grandis TaxID=71139 RepID=UPI00192EF8E7|nr:uncharacterized protein LOC120296010 [Eucalyptus grandis]